MKIRFVFVCSIFVMAGFFMLCVIPKATMAQSVFEDFEVDFPDTGILTKEELLDQTRFIEAIDPFNDPYSSYILFVPKTFISTPDESQKNVHRDGKLIGDIAQFHSQVISGAGSVIKVEAHDLKFNITAKNWLISYLLDFGYSIEGVKEHSEQKAEAIATLFNPKEDDFRDRIVIFKNGSRILMVKYSVPLANWQNEKKLQAAVTKTFKPLKEDKSTVISLYDYDFMGFVNFQYPETWTLTPGKANDYDRPTLKLMNTRFVPPSDNDFSGKPKNTYVGLIGFNMALYQNINTDLIAETERAKSEIAGMGFEIGDKLEVTYPLRFPKKASIKALEVYNLKNIKDNNTDFELWLITIKTEEYIFVIYMISPTKSRDFKAWIENKSTMEQLISSIKPIYYQ